MLERLSPEDARILALESGPIVGHTCKVVIADGGGDTVERLREQIDDRIGLARRCRQRIVPTPLRLAAAARVDDPAFDVRRHVRAYPTDGPVERKGLLDIAGRLMSERLPRDPPLWAIDVVEPLEDGRAAASWRIHHTMADGQATMAIGSSLLWSDSRKRRPAVPPPPAEAVPGPATLVVAAAADHAQALRMRRRPRRPRPALRRHAAGHTGPTA
jgi:diacylglycerol O-acyltransferase / wax synthase